MARRSAVEDCMFCDPEEGPCDEHKPKERAATRKPSARQPKASASTTAPSKSMDSPDQSEPDSSSSAPTPTVSATDKARMRARAAARRGESSPLSSGKESPSPTGSTSPRVGSSSTSTRTAPSPQRLPGWERRDQEDQEFRQAITLLVRLGMLAPDDASKYQHLTQPNLHPETAEKVVKWRWRLRSTRS